MYYHKYKHSICFLFIICLLFFGVYCEIPSNTPVFVCSTSDSVSDYDSHTLPGFGDSTASKQVYATQSLEQREIISGIRLSARRNSLRINRGNLFTLSLTYIISWLFINSFVAYIREVISLFHNNTIILNYIHHKDGKKSPILF